MKRSERSEGMDSNRPEPRVSVIIPAYRAAGFLPEALDSVFAQTLRDVEVIVVDDGSPDGDRIRGIVNAYDGAVRLIVQDNRGPGGARNAGLAAARGELVAFLDADDCWFPDYLAQQVWRFDHDPGLDLSYTDALLFGEAVPEGVTQMQRWPSRGPVSFESLVRLECMIFTSCVVARRDALLAAGLFDERFHHSEDFDLWVRLAHAGRRITYDRRALVRRRVHVGSLAAATGSLIRGQREVSRNLMETLELTAEQRRLLEEHISWCTAQLDLLSAKRLLLERRYAEAVAAMGSANRHLRSWKLHCARWGMRAVPGVVRRLYEARAGLRPAVAVTSPERR